MIGRPKKPCAHLFISPATCSATFVNTGSRWMASLRLRWLSRDMAEVWPRAFSRLPRITNFRAAMNHLSEKHLSLVTKATLPGLEPGPSTDGVSPDGQGGQPFGVGTTAACLTSR